MTLRLHGLSLLLLAGAALTFAVPWFLRSRGALFEPNLQTDDARTHLVGFHRFTAGAPLDSDPLAARCLAMQPTLFRLLGQALAPFTGVCGLAKCFQFLALGIALAGAAVLARSPRAGPGAAAMLLFSVLGFHWWIGGTPRQFAVPLLGLWISGALTGRMTVRAAAAVLAAGLYPVAMVLILSAEGLLAARTAATARGRARWRPAILLAATVALCGAIHVSGRIGNLNLGPVATRADIRAAPALFAGVPQLPAEPALTPFTKGVLEYLSILNPAPRPRDDPAGGWAGPLPAVLAWGTLSLLVWALAARTVPAPWAATALFVGATLAYLAAAVAAYRLYLPQRYSEYGYGAAAAAFIIGSLGGLRIPKRSFLLRQTLRNILAAVFVAGLWLLWGGNYRPDDGANIRRSDHAALYDFVDSLPRHVRFAAHPLDADDIPFWGRRAVLAGFELDQPFFLEPWRDAVARAWDTLELLYATAPSRVLDLADRHGVTHLLLNHARYGADFRKRARYERLEPGAVKAFLKIRRPGELVLGAPPTESVVFRDNRFSVVEVARLRAAWSSLVASPAPNMR